MAVPIRRKLAEDIADYLAEKIVQMEIQHGPHIGGGHLRACQMDVLGNGPFEYFNVSHQRDGPTQPRGTQLSRVDPVDLNVAVIG